MSIFDFIFLMIKRNIYFFLIIGIVISFLLFNHELSISSLISNIKGISVFITSLIFIIVLLFSLTLSNRYIYDKNVERLNNNLAPLQIIDKIKIRLYLIIIFMIILIVIYILIITTIIIKSKCSD